MIRSIYRNAKGEVSRNLEPEQVHEALKDSKGTLWLDIAHVADQKQCVADYLRDLFGFHELAVADALHESHIPRIDDWETYLYIVLHAIDLELNRTLDTHELDIFLGANYLVTVHDEPIPALDRLWDQCQRGVERRLASGPDHLLYALCDAIVADYMPVVDGLDDELDEVEADIFAHPGPRTISRIFRLRRTLLQLRRMLGSLREVMNRLARDDYQVIDVRDRVYFRDVYDHLVRLYDIIEGLRDMNAGALESYLSVSSNRINEVMRTMTVFTVLFMPLTFFTGFFGMNFFGEAYNIRNPEGGETPFAWANYVLFWLSVAVMLATPIVMLWWMGRKGWLRSVTQGDEDKVEP
jgi:magnesium transporter